MQLVSLSKQHQKLTLVASGQQPCTHAIQPGYEAKQSNTHLCSLSWAINFPTLPLHFLFFRRTTGSRSDPGMLWQSYRAACLRNENEVAHERFSTYLRLWVEAGEQVCSPPPMISLESDRFGILSPSIA